MFMDDDVQIGDKEKQRADLHEEVARIVAAASAQGRQLTTDEDAHVLALMGRVRALDEEIHRLVKHRAASRG
jgi:hypothetical protein